jgi:dTMP kinase
MVKIPPLAFALGMYIPQELNVPLLFGGFIAWWVSTRSKNEKLNAARFSRGTLIASGFIAGGSLFGVLNAFLRFADSEMELNLHLGEGTWAQTSGGELLGLLMFALLFAADRLDHTRARIIPTLEQGLWVVSDRCYLSSFAYQSVGCDLDWVRGLNRHCRRADLIILLDLDAEAAYRRVAARTLFENMEVFETADKLAVIRENYLCISERLKRESEHILIVDASPPADVVADTVREILSANNTYRGQVSWDPSSCSCRKPCPRLSRRHGPTMFP